MSRRRSSTSKLPFAFGVVLACGFAPHAHAGAAFGGMLGYSTGTLYRKTPEKVGGFAAQGLLGYSFTHLDLHGFFQHTSLSYAEHGELYEGTYATYGVGARFYLMSSNTRRITVVAQVPLLGSYAVLSKASGNINGKTYEQSTLTMLTGTQAVQGAVGYDWLAEGRAARGESLRMGVYLAYLNHAFTKQTTRIKTNNSELAPQSPGEETVGYSLSLLSFYLGVTYSR